MRIFDETVRIHFTGTVDTVLELFTLKNSGELLYLDNKPYEIESYTIASNSIIFDLKGYTAPSVTFGLRQIIKVGFRRFTVQCDKCESKRVEYMAGDGRYQCFACGHQWYEV